MDPSWIFFPSSISPKFPVEVRSDIAVSILWTMAFCSGKVTTANISLYIQLVFIAEIDLLAGQPELAFQ